MVFWHPKGWTDLAAGRAVHAPRLPRQRLPGGALPADPRRRACGSARATGRTSARTCSSPESEKRDYAVKPMNCPGHVQIFNAGLRSYRDLPLRYGEFGSCHRNEPSGALHGIMRVRGFTQDDGHIFCTEDQIAPRRRSTALLRRSTATSASTTSRSSSRRGRPSASAPTRAGTRPSRAEGGARALRVSSRLCRARAPSTARRSSTHLKDGIGRSWQCGTMQVDFMHAGRLGRVRGRGQHARTR